MVLMVPQYKQQLKQSKPTKRTIRQFPEASVDMLRGCFDCTDWQVFDCGDLNENTEVVTAYVKFCEELCLPTKEITQYPNNKPWFDSSLRAKLQVKDAAYKSRTSDVMAYKRAKYDLEKAIKLARATYRQKLEDSLASSNSRDLWSGVQKVTNYKPANLKLCSDDESLPNELNRFYARFDKTPPPHVVKPVNDGEPPLVIAETDVRRTLSKLNVRKAAGPDDISGRLLRTCAEQLSGPLTALFNRSLSEMEVPLLFKESTIIPIPKKKVISGLNDYRPVALTPIIMKVFESLVLQFIKQALPADIDQSQFAYRQNRSTEDAVSLCLHRVLEHLEPKSRANNHYVRLLFVDFSSAFNTILPTKLHDKLLDLGLPPMICSWLLDFLLHRRQRVKVSRQNGESMLSDALVLNTGAPQGCVLSPLMYSLFTSDCVSKRTSTSNTKFADDTTVAGLISDDDESEYRDYIDWFVSYCEGNNLELNVLKTKEIIIDFRTSKKSDIVPLVINGQRVEIVEKFKFLGTFITKTLSWDCTIVDNLKRAQQRIYFLRRLKSFGVSKPILISFYRATIESILSKSITIWYNGATKQLLKKLERVIKNAGYITGANLDNLYTIYSKRVLKRTRSIMDDVNHPAHSLFQMMPSGRRLRSMPARTERMKLSFYPSAIRTFNANN